MHIKKHIFKYCLLILTLAFGLVAQNNLKKTDAYGTPFVSDIDQYYSILPSAFLYSDIAYTYDTSGNWNQYYEKGTFGQRYWTTEYLENRKMTMATLGMPYAYSLFFIPALVADSLLGNDDFAPGYSPVYVFFAKLYGLALALITVLLLFKISERYTSKFLSALLSLLLFYGSGTLYYFFGEGLMPHAALTTLVAGFIWGCLRLLQDGKKSYLPILAFITTWIALIRPTDALVVLFPLILLVKSDARSNLLLSLKSWKRVLLSILLIAFLILPQLLYWNYITGSYIFYSYKEETFHFNQWHLLDFWFSFRKGWFTYTPLVLLALLLPVVTFKKLKLEVAATYLIIIGASLLYAQWWCWWFGGSFGMRTMTQFVPFLIFPLVFFVARSSRILKISIFIIITMVSLNTMNLARKYHLGRIHYDSETYQSLKSQYFGDHKPYDYYGHLEKPDYKGARRNGVEFEFKQVLEAKNISNSERYMGNLLESISVKHGYVVAKVYHPEFYENASLVLKIVNERGEEIVHQYKALSGSNYNENGEGFNFIDYSFDKTDLSKCKVIAFIHNPLLEEISISKLELILY